MILMVLTHASFIVLSCLGAILQYCAIKSTTHPSVGNNPQFLAFQRGYFLAYFIALMADWLQGPYLYKLYSHYGFLEDQIAVLYVVGFASTVLLGTWAPVVADRFGRQKLCAFFSVIYSLACFLKLSRSYGVLIVGRVLGGISTSLLFSSFEAWYVHEHTEAHDFPKEWIAVTFSKANVWNGVLAILAGIEANMFAEWFGFGPVAPFMLAIPCLVVSGTVVATQWKENYSTHKVKLRRSCMDGLREIVTSSKIAHMGAIQSLFESVMYIVIFIWTPVLDQGKPSLGIVFSNFMVCIMIGSAIYQLLDSRHVTACTVLTGSMCLALVANVMCVFSTHPDNINRNLSFVAFLLFEVAVGLYFPAMTKLRNNVLPEAHHTSIMAWFRVPLNILACLVLMLLHGTAFRHGNRLIFIICSCLICLAIFSVRRLTSLLHNTNINAETA